MSCDSEAGGASTHSAPFVRTEVAGSWGFSRASGEGCRVINTFEFSACGTQGFAAFERPSPSPCTLALSPPGQGIGSSVILLDTHFLV